MKIRYISLTVIIILIVVVNAPIFERFTVSNERTGAVVFAAATNKYKEFYISFTHSVNRTPVNEYYRLAVDGFILEKATFLSYGAGMPEAGEYGSGEPSLVNGMVQLDNINKEFKKFTYYAGTYANHSLNTEKSKIFFTQFVRPQTPVTFEIKKLSILTLLRVKRN